MNEGTEILFANSNTINNYPTRGAKRLASLWQTVKCDDIGFVGVYGGLGASYIDGEFTDYTDITAKIENLCTDEKVKGIVLCIYSPGGTVAGFYDACEYIKNCGKNVYAYIDGEACSAAYGLATACNKIYASSHSVTGCCGCYASCISMSDKKLEEMGFVRKIFRSANAPKKNISPITDENASKEYQARIDEEGNAYLAMVADNRGVDKDTAEKTFGQGAVVSAEYALENNMIDAIGSLEDCITDLKSSLNEQGGEEDINMTLNEQFDALSSEEQVNVFNAIVSSHPSLLEERDKEVVAKEKTRLDGLNSLRNGSEQVNAIVDEAVANGKCAGDIALDVVKAMQEQKLAVQATNENNCKANLTALADSDTVVNVPAARSEEDLINDLVDRLNK